VGIEKGKIKNDRGGGRDGARFLSSRPHAGIGRNKRSTLRRGYLFAGFPRRGRGPLVFPLVSEGQKRRREIGSITDYLKACRGLEEVAPFEKEQIRCTGHSQQGRRGGGGREKG